MTQITKCQDGKSQTPIISLSRGACNSNGFSATASFLMTMIVIKPMGDAEQKPGQLLPQPDWLP